jgi:hypothetical protein
MTQSEINQAVAMATGESVLLVQELGFGIADPLDVEFDPEPRLGRDVGGSVAVLFVVDVTISGLPNGGPFFTYARDVQQHEIVVSWPLCVTIQNRSVHDGSQRTVNFSAKCSVHRSGPGSLPGPPAAASSQ